MSAGFLTAVDIRADDVEQLTESHLESVPSISTSMRVRPRGLDPRLERRTTKSAGRGIFAVSALRRGDVVFSDTAILCAASASALHAAAQSDASRFDHLCGNSLAEKLQFNCFMTDEDGHMCFRELSHVNHSCSPNCRLSVLQAPCFHVFGPTAEVTVTRSIAPGEELTLSYIDVLAPRDTRRALLAEQWHFECECARCEGRLDATETRAWLVLEQAAQRADATKPSGPELTAEAARELSCMQRAAIVAIDSTLPWLAAYRARFEFDAAYFEPG